jgi:hypothetical protein
MKQVAVLVVAAAAFSQGVAVSGTTRFAAFARGISDGETTTGTNIM